MNHNRNTSFTFFLLAVLILFSATFYAIYINNIDVYPFVIFIIIFCLLQCFFYSPRYYLTDITILLSFYFLYTSIANTLFLAITLVYIISLSLIMTRLLQHNKTRIIDYINHSVIGIILLLCIFALYSYQDGNIIQYFYIRMSIMIGLFISTILSLSAIIYFKQNHVQN